MESDCSMRYPAKNSSAFCCPVNAHRDSPKSAAAATHWMVRFMADSYISEDDSLGSMMMVGCVPGSRMEEEDDVVEDMALLLALLSAMSEFSLD